MDTELDIVCVYVELREAMLQTREGFLNYALYSNYKNCPEREHGASYYKELAKRYVIDAYKGLKTYLQYDIMLDITANFSGVREFVKIGRGTNNATEAIIYFDSQIKYFDKYYEKNSLWDKAAKIYRNDRNQFEKYVAPYKQSNHDLLPAVLQRLEKK